MYKEKILKDELEEIKIYNIKPKESYEVITIKEKLVKLKLKFLF